MPNTIKDIIATMKSKGYEVDTRPYALNVVGVRNSNATDQYTFDDKLAYFYYDGSGVLRGKIVAGTTDPSTYYLQNPMSGAKDKGTAILKSGQYKNVYRIGLHRNKYEALVQTGGKVTTIRDNDRNAYINYFAPTTSGYYGINIHRASRGKKNEATIDYDSAGCQVFMREGDFNEMMSLARIHRDKYGNKFTYTLIDERDLLKAVNTTILLLVLGAIIYYAYKKK
jgi:hypothetical protein